MKANNRWRVLGAVIMLFGVWWALVGIQQMSAQEQREPVTVTELPDSPDDPPVDIHIAQYVEQYPDFLLSVAIPYEGQACLHTRNDLDCFEAVNLNSLHVDYAYNLNGTEYVFIRIRRDIELRTEGFQEVLSSFLGDDTRSRMTLDLIMSMLADDMTESIETVIQAPDRQCMIALDSQLMECW